MPKIIEAAMYVINNFTDGEIKNLKKMNIINNRVLLAIDAKKCFDKQKHPDLRTRYENTAEDMGLSERYIRKLLNE